MNASLNAKDLQEKSSHLKSYWRQLGLKRIVEASDDHAFYLSTCLTAGHIPNIQLTAVLKQGLNPESLSAVIDAQLPATITLSPATQAFIQQASAVLAPIALIINPEAVQLVIRQARLISLNTKINSRAMLDTIQILAPLLHHACLQIEQQQLSCEEARTMADLLSEHWFEVIGHEA
ncbi:hypothetical protein GZ77_16945 [Endozoicomonas montiporae]|uniref:Uncharacterized protein n=2 Tax=Endozoicomonas montiporae TaxID=1027273 RepID=A0A081N659_9GAMM|nr:hypothetical protein [Endozoicomonas montiporae]AMO57145.1 hypothetical protein EZMO1_3139 [Endozoicomonas montiporae CL-33]KEQ13932.1 hypothetical protein GZ77_16945 [Endozoicomonas montiporae]